jgi:L-malate glycosyltransferase
MATAGRMTSGGNGRLKLLFVLDAFPDPHAGTERQFLLLLNHLDQSEFDMEVWLLRESEYLKKHAPCAVRTLDIHSLRSARAVLRLVVASCSARLRGFQIAHIFFNDAAMVFPPLLKLLGVNVIVSRRDLGFWYTPANLRVLKIARRFVDRVVANCQAVKDAVCRAENFAREQVTVIYNAWQARAQTTPGRHAARESLDLHADARVLTLVANLRPLKRVDDAIRALARVNAHSGATTLLVIGEDRPSPTGPSLQAELEALAEQLRIRDCVRFLGKLADPTSAIVAADVCLLCSETEGMSNSVIEYMSLGKPVVCTNAGGNAELIEDGANGFVVPIGDCDALSDRICKILGDPALALQMGSESRQRVEERFSLQAGIRAHSDLYRQIVLGQIADVRRAGP